MSKQLEKLTEKALRTGFANLNGRMSYGYISTLESKWQVQYDNETTQNEAEKFPIITVLRGK